MNDDHLFIAKCILVGLLIFGAVGAGGYFFEKAVCDSKTADIGYAHRFGMWTGCLIEIEDGRWIPLDAYYYQERP